MGGHVTFIDQYVTEEELIRYLLASDIYITPYLNKEQITSGTLCYAISGGSAVVSTPYWHAEELLASNRGLLFDFKDHKTLGTILLRLLDNPEEMNRLKRNAYAYGLTIAWPKIGMLYIDTFNEAIKGYTSDSGRFKPTNIKLPELDLTHLERLTDDIGLIQHAIRCVPDYQSGYSLDDNARALMVCLFALKQTGDKRLYPLISKYAAYMAYVQNPDGSFKNYLTFDRQPIEEVGSDDAFGRAIWALGVLIRFSPNDSLFQVGLELFHKTSTQLGKLRYARGHANCILGLYHYIKRFPDQENYVKMLVNQADILVALFNDNHKEGWPWFESSITYDNGLLPASLYAAYEITERPEYLMVADQSRSYLETKCLINSHLTLIGNKTWWIAHHPISSIYAQQPIDAMAMVLLYDFAYKATGALEHVEKLTICFQWFLGMNDLNLPLYDNQTQGCNDGLEEMKVNRNQGAESIIAYLYSYLIAKPYMRQHQ